MALYVDISCEGSEIHLPDNAVLSYSYYSDTDGYARGYPRQVKLEVAIDVFALLSNAESTAAGMEVVKSIREWGNMRFKKDCECYYRNVTLTQTHDEELFRRIGMSHAYVGSFEEVVELHKRVHTIELSLLQREDKLVLGILEMEDEANE